MELREFVSMALTQITEGVVEAQKNLEATGARVNPTLRHLLPKGEKNYPSVGWAEGEGGNPVQMVSFDVAVTASEGTNTKGGIGVVTGVLNLGSSGASEAGKTSASRIAFQVPLLLPSQRKGQ